MHITARSRGSWQPDANASTDVSTGEVLTERVGALVGKRKLVGEPWGKEKNTASPRKREA